MVRLRDMQTRTSPLRRLSELLVSQPLIYDMVQVLAGSRECYRRLHGLFPDLREKRVLDVGGGTGRTLAVLPPSARYVCADLDPMKLRGLRAKDPAAQALLADAQALPVRSASFDLTICAFVCHHLEDRALAGALAEMARVTRGATLIMEPLWVPERRLSRAMWGHDRGAFPRTSERLRAEVDGHFVVGRTREFTILHQYVILECFPKSPA